LGSASRETGRGETALSTESIRPDYPAPELPQSLQIIRILWRGRFVVAACTLVCALAAGIVSFLLPETFESSASLLLIPPPFKDVSDLSTLMPKVLTVPDYEILLTSDGMLMEAANRVKSLGTWPPDDMEILDEPSQLRKFLRPVVKITEKTVSGVSYSPVIVLKARAGSPEQARDLAKAWAEVTEELTATLYQKGKTGLKDFVTGRFDASREDLMGVHEELLKIELEWNDELEHARLFKKHERLLNYEEKLTDMKIQIATSTKELEDLKAKIATEPERKTLWRSPPMTAVFMDQASPPARKDKSGAEPAGYQEEVLNQTFDYLKEKIILKESELANMREYETQMASTMGELGAEVEALRAESAQRSFDRKTLEFQLAPLKGNYDLLATKLEQAKIAEAEQENITDIKVVSEPVVPDRKVSPMRSLIVVMAAFVGFVVSVAAVYFRAMIIAIA
jgi:uncharacterized protein involved in exopolysaccharide biosynthesis